MNERNLNEGQWEDRKQWSLGVGQRRKTFWNRYTYILRKKASCCDKQAYWHWWRLWGKCHMQLAGSWKPLLLFLQCWHFIKKNGRISHIRLGGSISKCTNVYFWTLSSEHMPKLIHHVNPHLHTMKLLKTQTACIQDVPDLNLSQGTDCSEVSKTFLTTSMEMPE